MAIITDLSGELLEQIIQLAADEYSRILIDQRITNWKLSHRLIDPFSDCPMPVPLPNRRKTRQPLHQFRLSLAVERRIYKIACEVAQAKIPLYACMVVVQDELSSPLQTHMASIDDRFTAPPTGMDKLETCFLHVCLGNTPGSGWLAEFFRGLAGLVATLPRLCSITIAIRTLPAPGMIPSHQLRAVFSDTVQAALTGKKQKVHCCVLLEGDTRNSFECVLDKDGAHESCH